MNILGNDVSTSLILTYAIYISVLSILIAIVSVVVAARTNGKLKRVLKDKAGKDITESIVSYYKKCNEIAGYFKSYEEKINYLERQDSACVKKIGLVKYDAFHENKSKLSFAVALLDERDTGFVLNGMYVHGQTVTYLKPVVEGLSDYELTEEEIEAINSARMQYEEKMKQK